MAPNANGSTVSLDELIQADRKKQKSQILAQQMFGKDRSASGLSAGSGRNFPTSSLGASLASRIGVQKRSSSGPPRSNIDGQWTHDLHRTASPRGSRAVRQPRTLRDENLFNAIQKSSSSNSASSQVNVKSTPSNASMSIRGMAQGPYVVIASNFALGTSAADIEAAVTPIGGKVESCRLITASPTVMAEIVFTEREGAENVIATYNNQKADGKLLYVYLKPGGPSPILPSSNPTSIEASKAEPQRKVVVDELYAPTEPRSAPLPQQTSSSDPADRDAMEIDDNAPNSGRPRGPDLRDKPPLSGSSYNDRRGPSSGYQDSRYGSSRDGYGSRQSGGGYGSRNGYGSRGLYSDGMYRGGQRYRP